MAIKFDITADNSGLLRATKQSEDAFQSLENRAQGATDSIKSVFQEAAALGGISLGVAGMKQFVSKVYEVRSYFQDINSSMVAFLGNQEKADEFTKKLKDYAWYNMFEFSELAQASQQMIAYGANVEDIIPTIDKLSNIAVATKANLLDLVGMYNKAKSVGKVDSNATASWATHGLVIKNFLTDAEKATDYASFSFEQLERAITTATSEGGLFYQQQDKMMDNLSSSWGQLQDDMDSMFNEIGEVMQKPMKQGIEFASELVDNYKEIAKTLAEIVATYGLYKAAVAGATSMDRMAGNLTTQAEVEALNQYIVVEKEVENEDIKAMLTKGELSQASFDRIAALRAETAAEEEQRASELNSAVLRGQISEERASEVKSLRQKLAIQLDAARVEEETAKQAYESAKDTLVAVNDEIDAYYKVIASHEELGDATYKQLHASEAVELQDKKAAAQKAVLTAEENLNTASIQRNTLEQGRQVVMQQVSIRTMGMQKAAALQLKNIWGSITAMVDSNPIMIYAAAIAALAYGVYKLATAESDEEKARRRSNEAWEEFKTKQDEYAQEVDNLVSIVQDENKTQNQRYSAWNKLKTLMPQITEEYKSMQELANADKDRVEQIKNENIELEERKQVLEDVAKAEEKVANAKRNLDFDIRYNSGQGALVYSSQLKQYEAELEVAKEKEKEYWISMAENNKQMAEDAKPIEIKIQEAKDNKQRIDDAVEYLGKATDIMKSQSEDVPIPMRVDPETAKKNLNDLIKVVEDKLSEAKRLSDENPLDMKAYADVESLQNTLNTLLSSKSEWELNGYTTVPLKLQLDEATMTETAVQLNNYVETLETQMAKESDNGTNTNKKYWEEQKKKAEEKLNGLSTEQLDKIVNGTADKALKQTYKEATDEYNKAVKEIAKYDWTGKSSKNAATLKKQNAERQELIATQERDLKRAEEDAENAIAQMRINAMNDGAKREQEQRELNHKKTLQQIKRQQSDAVDAAYDKSKQLFEKDPKNKNKVFTQKDAEKDKYYLKAVRLAEQSAKTAIADEMRSYFDVSDLLNTYQDYTFKKIVLDERYASDRKQLEDSIAEYHRKSIDTTLSADERAIAHTNEEMAKNALKQLGISQNKDRANLAMEQLKLDPSYVQAFEDLKYVSSDTLDNLYKELEKNKEALADLDPQDLKVITDLMQQIFEEKTERNPLEALRQSTKELADARYRLQIATNHVVMAQNKLNDAQASGDPFSIAEAEQELNEALAEQEKKTADAEKAQAKALKTSKNLSDQVAELGSAISGVGSSIGGMAGEIISLAGDVLSFVSTTTDSIKAVAATGAAALSTIEKASVILTIVSVAIQLVSKLNELTKDYNANSKNEKLAEKQKRINLLAQSVNMYAIAVAKANAEENTWFGNSSLSKMASLAEVSAKASTAYFDKLNESQQKYMDEATTGWLTDVMSLPAKAAQKGLQAIFGDTIGGIASWIADPIGAAVDQLQGDSYFSHTNLVKAIDNLRIETKHRSHGFLGSGIGAKAQQTKDLRDWARENFNAELFDEKNFINVQLAETIIESYGDKLQGETKQTLEELISLREQYEEYQDSLRDYVSSMYEPIVGNFVDSMWDWFIEGKDALDSFKDYASDTFGNIVKDLMKTIVLRDIVEDFKDQITELYDQYNFHQIDEETLMKGVSDITKNMMSKYETEVPAMQKMITQITGIIQDTSGVDIKGEDKGISSSNAAKGMAASFSQDSLDEANGRMTAIQLQNEAQIAQLLMVATNTSLLLTTAATTNIILEDMRTMDAIRNSYLSEVVEIIGLQRKEQSAKLDIIAESLKNI